MSSPLTTHVLDTASGKPAGGLPITLERQAGDGWTVLNSGVTNADGRVQDLLAEGELVPDVYRMRFDTGAYFARHGQQGFYPYVEVVFQVTDPGQHHHVPLLLAPFGYSTYRGS